MEIKFPAKLGDLSVWSLIFSNLFTIFFAITEHWSLTTVMFVYWWQNVIIGFFNAIKILTFNSPLTKTAPPGGYLPARIALATFFVFHYGFFHYGYFSFLEPSLKNIDLKFVSFTTAVFFINHFFSLLYNYKADSEKSNVAQLIFSPYKRIIPMHLTIVFGGIFMMLLRNSFAEQLVLVFFIILKTWVDVKMHQGEHTHSQDNKS